MSSSDPNKETYFGYEKVSYTDKTKKVADVFHSVANRYDLMNDVMSLGVHRLWKQLAIELTAVKPHHFVLDLAAGTGDLSIKIAPLITKGGMLCVTDINASMLKIAQKRLIEKGLVNNVHFCQVNAENIPFPANTFDCVIIGFGLRNVTHKEAALKAVHHVLKPGGKFIILEFSHPGSPLLSHLYDFYSFNFLPFLGKVFASDENSYRYLAESIRLHPNQDTLCRMMEQAGFEKCDYHNLTGGIVAIHRGYKID